MVIEQGYAKLGVAYVQCLIVRYIHPVKQPFINGDVSNILTV